MTTLGQVNQSWVATFNGAAAGFPPNVAVDAAGNVYVAGTSVGPGTGNDYVTIKYDAAGTPLWVVPYNGPANAGDMATSLAIDSEGNVIVTGYSVGVGTGNYDYATIKYDAEGHELWARRYNGPANGSDTAFAVTVDADGNIYVTGGGTTNVLTDIATIKYDRNGKEVWVSPYNGPGNGTDGAYAIALGASGDVYVAGKSDRTGAGPSGTDYITIRYAPDGTQLWEATYDGTGQFSDGAQALAVDDAGNAYVTGWSARIPGFPSPPNWEYATVKFDANGQLVWASRYDAPGSGDTGRDIGVDADGNVYVTGDSDGSGAGTIKYDDLGDQLWVQPTTAKALALDAAGSVYVATWWGNPPRAETIKYDTDGNQVWLIPYTDPTGSTPVAWDIAVDSPGHVYVTFLAGGNIVTIKYAQACYPDCNTDGSLTVADFGCFQTKFVLADPYADCNADGQHTVADFGCFQTKFVVGCP